MGPPSEASLDRWAGASILGGQECSLALRNCSGSARPGLLEFQAVVSRPVAHSVVGGRCSNEVGALRDPGFGGPCASAAPRTMIWGS